MQQLAEMIGTSKSQISKLESGERRLTQHWMERLATALNCSAADFLPDTDTELQHLNINGDINTMLGGEITERQPEDCYRISFRPPEEFKGFQFIGLRIEGDEHTEFKDGTELIFLQPDTETELKSGKYVLVEEERNGRKILQLGQLEVSPTMIAIIFRAHTPHHQHTQIYWQAENSKAASLNENFGTKKLPTIPLQHGNTRIAGILTKSIRSE